eukprot:scaffold1136_cov146-Cylindrotheca_fusiformis.AAC.22
MEWGKKKRQKLTKKLGKVKGAMRTAVSKANDALSSAKKDSLEGSIITITAEPQVNSGFLGRLHLATEHDVKVETIEDERTGSVTTKMTTTHKQTGKVVSTHAQRLENDGTIHIESSGRTSSDAKSPFQTMFRKSNSATSSSSTHPPPEWPETGEIDYTVEGTIGEYYNVHCKVVDGPEAGKVIEYIIQDNGEDEEPTYEMVRIHKPLRTTVRKWGLLGMTALVLVGVAIGIETWGETILDHLCMPVAPYTKFSSSSPSSVRWEAPWWAPGRSTKAAAFSLFCQTKGGERRRRTSFHWKRQGKFKHQLLVQVLKDTNTKRGKAVKTTAKKEINKSGVQTAVATSTAIDIVYNNGKTSSIPAPWHSVE